jgi:predicted kinase
MVHNAARVFEGGGTDGYGCEIGSSPLLQHTKQSVPLDPSLPEVVLLCGLAGSGKTTFSQRLEEIGYVRLSIDEAIWERFGRFAVDYEETSYAIHSTTVESDLKERLAEHIASRKNVVVDNSFWKRNTRDTYKRLVVKSGGRWRLIYLKIDASELRRRLEVRAPRFDANAAFPITDEILDKYIRAFEAPSGEGEEIWSTATTHLSDFCEGRVILSS